MPAAIHTESLTKFYGPVRGIEGLDLEVRRGEVFGYLGPNGAGKTTTIRTLLDLIHPTSGRAEVLGLDSQADPVAIHRRVGFLPGELSMYPKMTGGELVEYFANLRGGTSREHARELADRLELDLTRPIGDYSSGNRQKVGLVQAFMHSPELLILDEPTSALDPLVQQEFYRLVDEVRRGGRTVFLSSHVLPEVERIADRVGVVRDGHLVAVESVEGLKARAVRTVEIRFAAPIPSDAFALVEGVRENRTGDDVVELTIEGPMDAVVKRAADFEVHTIVSHETDLEDVFLAMYRDEG